jgi:hypothetical protein
MKVRILAVSAALLLSAGSAQAALGDLKPIDCKFAKDGTFTSREEYRVYLLHQMSDEYKYFDKQCNGHTPGQHEAYQKALEEQMRLPLNDYKRRTAHGGSIPAPPKPASNGTLCSTNGNWNSCFILRDSFEDISIFSGPKDISAASGATFGWTKDDVAANRSWSAKGVAAYPFSWLNPDPAPASGAPYLVGLAFTPSMTFNRLTNSNPKLAKNDINVLNFNGGGEVGIGNLLDRTTTHYFRLRGGVQTDFDGNTHAWNATAEYQPITKWEGIPHLSSPNALIPNYAVYEIDLIGRVQHFEKVGTSALPLFATHPQIDRGGPVAAFSIWPQQGPDSPVPLWLQRFNFTATYSRLWDFNTSNVYGHFMTSLGFALDDNGNVGVKLSFERGKVEETGQDIQVTKISLTAKY